MHQYLAITLQQLYYGKISFIVLVPDRRNGIKLIRLNADGRRR